MTQESERSSMVYTANWKETVELKRTISDLTRSKRTVEHSMYLAQKIVYKRFQTKMHQSQLFLSRLKGDREMERQLRAKTGNHFNTNCGTNEEEERKLKQMLRRPTTSRPETRSTLRPLAPPPNPAVQHGSSLYRSKSVDGMTGVQSPGAHVTFDKSHHASLVSLPGTPVSGHSRIQGQYLDTSKRAYGPRPHTIQGLPNLQGKIDHGLGDRPGTVAALLEDDSDKRKRILTQINTNRIKSANFQHRVNRFCDTVNHMASRTDNALDYYNVRLRNNTCSRENIINIPKTPESEYWRHVGDFRKKPITFHGVRYDVMDDLANKRMSIRPGTQTNQYQISDVLS
ncbi:uncharacterized protein LOC135493399 [Lineus longissimus]|uniref:uncharacterized protein LOC135493399 n=1 Tax=Lineus longissimus TaxID=88925 RepID=UPI002B4F2041